MDNGNGDTEKLSNEQKAQENINKLKEFVTEKTILVVRLNEYGAPQWLTSLPPTDLNLLLDRMKFNIVNPPPPLIEKPKTVISNIKGAFGKKRF